MKQVKKEIIGSVLALYKDEYVCVESAQYEQKTLTCQLRYTEYPYTRSPIFDYITSVMATLVACQLSYLLFAVMIMEDGFELQGIKTLEEFIRFRDDARLKFLRYDTKYSHKVLNLDNTQAVIKLTRTLKANGRVIYVASISIGEGIHSTLLLAVD